jgi:hypothetical protein
MIQFNVLPFTYTVKKTEEKEIKIFFTVKVFFSQKGVELWAFDDMQQIPSNRVMS